MRVKLALLNSFRNGRRTALNILMIAGGVTGIILFNGFSYRVLFDLREITIKSRTGHLQLAREAYWEKKSKNAKDVLMSNYASLSDQIRHLPGVSYAAGRLSFFGLLSAGDDTISARGLSLDPTAEKSKNESFQILRGTRLTPDANPFQIMVGSGLAKRLGLEPGANATVLAYTFDGTVNAIDLRVVGIFHTSISEVDDTTFMAPLVAVQRLLDTDKVEQVVVGLDDTDKTPAVLSKVQNLLRREDPGITAKSWWDLATYYHQAVSFFHTQNRVFELIILSLVLLGVLNTVGMSILERTAEIGTIQALGETQQSVLTQFIGEGIILGLSGALSGALVGTLVAIAVNALGLPITIPGASTPLTLRIDLLASSYFQASILAISAATFAAFAPALRASRMNIVEALRRYV